MKNFISGILILIMSSCSSKDDLLKELSVNCMYEITSYWELSTDRKASNTREVSFKNSKLFSFGVTKESFAISSAILLNDNFRDNTFKTIKLNLVEGNDSSQKVDTYSFAQNEIDINSPTYFKSKKLMNEFIRSIYDKDLSKNFSLMNIKESQEEYGPIFNKLHDGLAKGYIDTRVVGFNKKDSIYQIDAGIYYKSGALLLFSSRLKEIDGNLKIIGFDF